MGVSHLYYVYVGPFKGPLEQSGRLSGPDDVLTTQLAQEGGDLEIPVALSLEDARLVGLDAPQHAEKHLRHVTARCISQGVRYSSRGRTLPGLQHHNPPRILAFHTYTHKAHQWPSSGLRSDRRSEGSGTRRLCSRGGLRTLRARTGRS